jgi:hypothetical protein
MKLLFKTIFLSVFCISAQFVAVGQKDGKTPSIKQIKKCKAYCKNKPTPLCDTTLKTPCYDSSIKVKLDFSNKQMSSDDLQKIREGEFYQLEIIDINLNLYKVSVNHSDTSTSTEINFPSFGISNIDAIKKTLEGVSALSTSAFFNPFDVIMVNKSFTETPPDGMDSLEQEIVGQINQYADFNQFLLDSLTNLNTSVENLTLKLNLFLLMALSETETGDDLNIKAIYKEFLSLRKELSQVKSVTIANQNEFQSALDGFSEAIKKSVLKEITAVNKVHSSIVSAIDTALKNSNAEALNKVFTQAILFDNNKKHSYTSLPMQFKGEQGELNLTISPKDPKHPLQAYTTKIRFPKEKRNYVAVGGSFFKSTLHDSVYSFQTTVVNDTVKNHKLIQENFSTYEIGFATLLRFGITSVKIPKLGYHFNIGPGFAVSDKIKPRLMYGGGMSWGKKHYLALDFSFITGYLDVLSKAYEVDGEYGGDNAPIPVVSKLRTGLALSVGYFFKL